MHYRAASAPLILPTPLLTHSSGGTRGLSAALLPWTMSRSFHRENAQSDGTGTGWAVSACSSRRMMLCVK